MNTEAKDSCANCQTELSGPFCHNCGQENKNYIRSVWSVVTEFFGEFGNWDGRVWRTLIPLVLQPGRLSSSYVSGQRVRFVPPLRLYLFISILAFLVFSAMGNNFRIAGITPDGVHTVPIEQLVAPTGSERPSGRAGAETNTELVPEISNFQVGFLSEQVNQEISTKLRQVAQNPKLFLNNFFSLVPQLMLVMLPLFALWLKLLYVFQKRFYLEHLVLALHTHAFILVALLALLGLNSLRAYLYELTEVIAVTSALTSMYRVLLAWMVLYLLLAQKNFYKQSWFRTIVKFLLTGLMYWVLLFALLITAVVISVFTS